MEYCVIADTAKIEWILPRSANYILKNVIPNYHILNPVKHYKKYSEFNLIPDKSIIYLQNDGYVKTTGLILRFVGTIPADVFTVSKGVAVFSRLARHFSKQFEIDTKTVNRNIFYRDKIANNGKSITIYKDGIIMTSKMKETRVSKNDLVKIQNCIKNGATIPIYFDLFDESIADLKNGNYLKSLLLSAISIESFLNSRFDEIHEKKQITLSGFHKKNRKDYVFERIKNKTTPFDNLLREIPLYLKDKIVIADHDAIFKGLKKLYSTRNKIVHWGGPDVSTTNYDDLYFRIDNEGAYEGAKLVNKTFELYGIKNYTKVFQKSSYQKF